MFSHSHFDVNLKLAALSVTELVVAMIAAPVALEEDDSFQLFVVEQIVERPEATFLAERIRLHVRVVTVDLTFLQTDLVVDRFPQSRTQLNEVVAKRCREVCVDVVDDEGETRFPTEFLRLSLTEIVVGECRVECGQQRE